MKKKKYQKLQYLIRLEVSFFGIKLFNIIIKNITVSEKQINETFELLIKTSGEVEYNISEIFVSADNIEAEQRINSIYSRIDNRKFPSTCRSILRWHSI